MAGFLQANWKVTRSFGNLGLRGLRSSEIRDGAYIAMLTFLAPFFKYTSA